MILEIVLRLHACQIVVSRSFFFFFFFSFKPINIISFLLSRVNWWERKTGDPWEKHLQPNPQAEVS